MARLGNTTKFYIRSVYTDSPTEPTVTAYHYGWLGCETANSLNRTQEAVECSDKSDTWARFIAGKRGGTIEATAYADNDDTHQAGLLEALHNGTKVWVLIGISESSMAIDEDDEILEGDLMRGVITAISDTNDFGACASRTFSLTLDEDIDHTEPEDEQAAPAAGNEQAPGGISNTPGTEAVPEDVTQNNP